jgi:hypothetical protein
MPPPLGPNTTTWELALMWSCLAAGPKPNVTCHLPYLVVPSSFLNRSHLHNALMAATSLYWSQLSLNGKLTTKPSKASLRVEWKGAGWVNSLCAFSLVHRCHQMSCVHHCWEHGGYWSTGGTGCDPHALHLLWFKNWAGVHYLHCITQQASFLGSEWW